MRHGPGNVDVKTYLENPRVVQDSDWAGGSYDTQESKALKCSTLALALSRRKSVLQQGIATSSGEGEFYAMGLAATGALDFNTSSQGSKFGQVETQFTNDQTSIGLSNWNVMLALFGKDETFEATVDRWRS